MELFNGLVDEIAHAGCEDLEAGLCQPLIAYIRAKGNRPPYVPQWDPMPLHRLCQLALLWEAAGFHTEAGQLAHFLAPLASFLPLWCPENQFNQQKSAYWFSRLASIDPIPSAHVPNLTLYSTPTLSAAFTLTGNGTSLGVLKSRDVEIRAMGPQSPTLAFGIKGKGEQNWTCCQALPEVWLRLNTSCTDRSCQIDLQFIGLTPETPLEFAFYVKAQTCQIAAETLKPKSLRRFSGEASTLLFQHLQLQSATPHKVRVIPLAGEGCFWDTEFLVAFEIPSIAPQLKFTIGLA